MTCPFLRNNQKGKCELMAKNNKNNRSSLNTEKVKIIPLGGLGEIGRNMTVIEYEDEIIVVDAGLGFPDESMLGVDLVIPDTAYLEENAEKIQGILLTHGHEDHIGALPYVLRLVNPPVYGTLLTLGILEGKLIYHPVGSSDNEIISCINDELWFESIKKIATENNINLFNTKLKDFSKTINVEGNPCLLLYK